MRVFKNNNGVFIFGFAILAINIFTLIIIKPDLNLNNNVEKVVPESYLIDIEDTQNQEYFINNYNLSNQYDSFKINNASVYHGNDSIRIFTMSDLINDRTLIFRFSGNFCDACNIFVINKLKQHFQDFETNDQILLLGTDIDPRLKISYYGKPILSYHKSNLGLPIEKLGGPFLFILDNNLVIKMLFLPDKSMPGYTDRYLELIKKYQVANSMP